MKIIFMRVAIVLLTLALCGCAGLRSPFIPLGEQNTATTSESNYTPPGVNTIDATKPRRIKEPGSEVRIWIAPWVNKNDTLNFEQYQIMIVKP